MPRDLEHLELLRIANPLPRRRYGGGRPPDRDRGEHGQGLLEQTRELVEGHRRRERPAGISPALIFKLVMHSAGNLDEVELGRMGLTVVARDSDKTIVVFSSDEQLEKFNRRLASYSGEEGPDYAYLSGIEGIAALGPEDRTGPLLREEPMDAAESAPLDVELWHPGDSDTFETYVAELNAFATEHGGRVSDQYYGTHLCLLRCHLTGEAVGILLEFDYVKEVDLVPRPSLTPAEVWRVGAADLGEIAPPRADAPGVLVVDSGVLANHPVLQPVMGDAELFASQGNANFSGGAADVCGHGTRVCGIAAYGTLDAIARGESVDAQVRLFSARVLDDQGHYDEDELALKQLEEAVLYFAETYPECKVVNLSIGDDRLYLRDGQKQFRLAAVIDDLALRLRDRGVLFVVSAGNFSFDPADGDERLTQYPAYLLRYEARIIDPGTAAIAVTVGSLATGNPPDRHPRDVRQAIARMPRYPSPFTRTGPGVDGMVKPEFVEIGGDEVFDPRIPNIIEDPGVGIVTTSSRFFPPEGRIFCFARGTSFSTPKLAHTASRLFGEFPGATPNLIRVLLAESARVPAERPHPLDGDPAGADVLRVYGYGVPSVERACFSASNHAVLITQDEVALDSFVLYELPPLPDGFLGERGDRLISVSLAYDPPTRHTRGDCYQGVTMVAHLFRNLDATQVEALFRDWARAGPGEGETELERKLSKLPDRYKVKLEPGVRQRMKGTLQKGVARIAKRNWNYDGDRLILAVLSLRKWAPESIGTQPYAVAVSVRHSDERVPVYARMRERTRIARRVRIRV